MMPSITICRYSMLKWWDKHVNAGRPTTLQLDAASPPVSEPLTTLFFRFVDREEPKANDTSFNYLNHRQAIIVNRGDAVENGKPVAVNMKYMVGESRFAANVLMQVNSRACYVTREGDLVPWSAGSALCEAIDNELPLSGDYYTSSNKPMVELDAADEYDNEEELLGDNSG